MFIAADLIALALASQLDSQVAGLASKVTRVETIALLQALPTYDKAVAFVTGKIAMGDGLGGFYYWDSASVATEDMTFLNTIASTVTTPTGRWIRLFQRARQMSNGILVYNGSVKTFLGTANTVGIPNAGDATLYLTDDGTANGNALFSQIYYHSARANQASADAANAIQSYFKSLSGNLKTLVYGNYKPNVLTLILNLIYNPYSAVGSGVPVQFVVHGI